VVDLGWLPDATALAVEEVGRGIRLGEIGSLAEAESQVANVLKSLTAVYGPQLAELVQPAVEKSVAAVKPMLDEMLKKYAPTAFAITGGLIAMSVLLGVYVAKKTYQRSRK